MSELAITIVQKFELLYNNKDSRGEFKGSYYRPIPPSGYYSIGDYGQNNYDYPAPNISVIAVKELADGILARPVDYSLIWKDKGSSAKMNGSFWLPIPPSGYKAIGTVTQKGHDKPLLDAIMCIREDLLLPAMVGKVVWTDKNTGADHYDFGSWQITSPDENAQLPGSFIGVRSHTPPTTGDNLYCINKDNIIKAEPLLSVRVVHNFKLLYNDRGSGGEHNGSFYRPIPPSGYYSIGDYGQKNYDYPAPNGSVVVVKQLADGILARPVGYSLIWKDKGSDAKMNGSFWLPIPPSGYKAIGTVAQRGHDKPSLDAIMCIREDLLLPAMVGKMVWNDKDTGADHNFGSWQITSSNEDALLANTFIGVSSHTPSNSGGNLFCINGNFVETENPKMPQLLNTEFIHTIKKIAFNKNGCPLNYHTCYSFRWQHLQDMIRLPDANGKQYYMGTFSQNCSDDEGGLVFVTELQSGTNKGKVIWWEELNNKHVAGGFNHPGDLRRIGNTVVIAGQNWKKTRAPGCAYFNMGNGGQGILFYDVTEPFSPQYIGKTNSCWNYNENKTVSGEIDMVAVSYSGGYYYLAFNGLKCRSRSFLPYTSWQLIQKGDDKSPSPVIFPYGSEYIAGDAAMDNGNINYRKINYSPAPNRLNKLTKEVSRESKFSVSIPKSSFPDGVTTSLSIMADGRGQVVYANVESDKQIEIEVVEGLDSASL